MCIDNPRRKEKIGLGARNILAYSCLFGREVYHVRKKGVGYEMCALDLKGLL